MITCNEFLLQVVAMNDHLVSLQARMNAHHGEDYFKVENLLESRPEGVSAATMQNWESTKHVTIATPNGSTAYNLSAGDSIVMESCECFCITPLATHSLSFRPLILPIDVKVTVKSTKGARVKA